MKDVPIFWDEPTLYSNSRILTYNENAKNVFKKHIADNSESLFDFEFLPQGQTVNQTVYKEIFWRLVRSVRDKRQSLWEAHASALHQDNAPAHTALSIRQFLAERNIATLKHPPYSADLALCDFFSSLRSNLF